MPWIAVSTVWDGRVRVLNIRTFCLEVAVPIHGDQRIGEASREGQAIAGHNGCCRTVGKGWSNESCRFVGVSAITKAQEGESVKHQGYHDLSQILGHDQRILAVKALVPMHEKISCERGRGYVLTLDDRVLLPAAPKQYADAMKESESFMCILNQITDSMQLSRLVAFLTLSCWGGISLINILANDWHSCNHEWWASRGCHLVKGFASDFKPIALANETKLLMPQNPIKPAAIFKLGIIPTVNPNFITCKCRVQNHTLSK